METMTISTDILDPEIPILPKKTMDIKRNKKLIKLFVNGLPKKMDEDELLQLFIGYHVNEAKIKCKGYGIVYFDRNEDAKEDHYVMNGY